MSFFEDASLVLIPSAQKTSKVYSVKPTDGTGDLTFTRSNDTATRVNSAGLIEKVRTNLALYSEDQTNWTNQNETSVTANAAANPLNGAVTADKVIPSATTDDHYRGLSMGSMIGEISSSIYVKADGYSIIDYGVYNSATGNYPVRAVFDLSTQAITYINGSIASITSIGSGWYRISVTASVASTGTMSIYHRVRPSGTSGTYAGNGTSGMLLWGCQLESGVTTPYIGPTTSAAVSVGPVANVPRLDYLNSSCPRLLLEPQRTNLYTFSEQTDNAAWGKTNASVTANNTASPDGYTNADKVVANTTNGVHRIEQDKATATQVATQSVFAKASGYNFIALENGGEIAYFNISTGVVGSVSGGTASIQNYGNGWYRCIFSATALNTKSYIYICSADNVITFAGDNTSGAFIYGAQFEAGAYATSYIPTLGAAVTRGADMSGTTNYFGAQTFAGDFTFFVDLLPMEGNTGISDAMILGGGDSTGGGNFQSYFRFASGQILLYGVAEALMIARNYTMNANQSYKILVTRTGTTVKIFANGAQVGASATSSLTVILRSLGWSYSQAQYNYDGRINQVLLMPSGLTDAQAIELTTI